jgi:hypothetical protein
METEPDLPEGMSWQFCARGNDITSTPLYAVDDAQEARIWTEGADLVESFTRVGDMWRSDSCGHTFGSLTSALDELAPVLFESTEV